MAPLINESDCFTLELEVPTTTTTTTMKLAQDTRNSSPTKLCKHDAFLHYSNDETRMNTLMMKEAPKYQRQQRVTQERKTRISFEVHPSLILEDLLFDNDGDCIAESDDIGSLLDCEDDSTDDIGYLLENTEADNTAQVDRETMNLFREMFQASPRRRLE